MWLRHRSVSIDLMKHESYTVNKTRTKSCQRLCVMGMKPGSSVSSIRGVGSNACAPLQMQREHSSVSFIKQTEVPAVAM
jgi:hypothetical protein